MSSEPVTRPPTIDDVTRDQAAALTTPELVAALAAAERPAYRAIAAAHGVSRQTVGDIHRGRTWPALPRPWAAVAPGDA